MLTLVTLYGPTVTGFAERAILQAAELQNFQPDFEAAGVVHG